MYWGIIDIPHDVIILVSRVQIMIPPCSLTTEVPIIHYPQGWARWLEPATAWWMSLRSLSEPRREKTKKSILEGNVESMGWHSVFLKIHVLSQKIILPASSLSHCSPPGPSVIRWSPHSLPSTVATIHQHLGQCTSFPDHFSSSVSLTPLPPSRLQHTFEDPSSFLGVASAPLNDLVIESQAVQPPLLSSQLALSRMPTPTIFRPHRDQ